MKTISLILVTTLAAFAADTVEQIIAKNWEARGGAAWDNVQSIKITGMASAFSIDSAVVIHKKRPNLLHIDQQMNNKTVIIGHDGSTLWWLNKWMAEGAQEMTDLDRQVALRQTHFVSRLQDYKESGYSASLSDVKEIDGLPCIAITLSKGEEQETWYLDPESYLEIAMDSPGSDFGQPVPQRLFYDDYREVKGVMVPYYMEAQFYTRNRTVNVESVEINGSIDDNLFSMPLPPGMDVLSPLQGSFEVKVESRSRPGAPMTESATQSEVSASLRGGLLQETFNDEEGIPTMRHFSYDAFSNMYRITQMDQRNTQLMVFQGTMEEDTISASTIESKTSMNSFGQTIHFRLKISGIESDQFVIETEASLDEGESWFTASKYSYTRKPAS